MSFNLRNKILLMKHAFINDNSTIVLFIKHFWGVIYRRRYCTAFFSLFFLFGLTIYVLLSWGIVCSNVEVWQQVHKVCDDYKAGVAVGNLCPPLCEHGRIHNMDCQPLHSGKELVFSAVLDGMPIVFKSSKRTTTPDIRTTAHWVDAQGYLHYPGEAEFYNMISSLVVTEMNVTATLEQIQKLTQLGPVPTRSELRHTEMDNLWLLLQDHEYLAIRLFSEQEIFPTLVGSCGDFFAVEFAEPLKSGVLWDHENEIWVERLRDAVLILELLERLDLTAAIPLRFCDVHLQHFGKSFDGTKIVILDGDSVVTKEVADLLSGDGQICQRHDECRYFDCYSSCENNRCVPPSVNNNMQSVCEKVFLGHKWGGALLVPGLLASPHASPSLTALLRLCAHPHGEEGVKHGTPDDVRERLQVTIEEMVNDIDAQVPL